MNSVLLIGNLTRDPETRTTGSGTTVCAFKIAVNRNTQEGGADYPRIKTFGKTAENCGRYLKKGSKVGIEGRLQTGSYEKQNGDIVSYTEVIANRVEFLSTRNSGDARPAEKEKAVPDFEAIDDDVPF